MKTTIYSLIISLFLALSFSCSGQYKTSTSEVTIIVKNNKTVAINIEGRTFVNRLKHIINKFSTKRVFAQSGSIPSYISAINVQVDAPDINPIIKTVDVQGMNEIVITLEVPNGPKRHFTIDALNSYGTPLNRGEAMSDLNGDPVTLTVDMLRTGLFVDTINGNDTNDCRTPQTPCKTLTSTVSKTNGNEAIYVAPGTYDVAINGETFPLNLPQGTAIICNQTVIDSATNVPGPGPAIISSQRNYIYGCHFQNSWPAINDNGNTITVDNILVNSGNIGSCVGVETSSDSVIKNSRFENISWTGCDTFGGIYITGGTPRIENNTFTNNQVPGINVNSGTPMIRNNSINNNSQGIRVMAGTPTINLNTISCNSFDLSIETSTQFDATNNAWDHAPPSVEDSSTGYCYTPGVDICTTIINLPPDIYTPYLPVATNPCP